MTLPFEQRPAVDHDVHTEDLPATPQRESRIPAPRWVEAPESILMLGVDLDGGPHEAGFLRRIGPWLLWRAGPAVDADARYGAVDSRDLDRSFTFRLRPDGSGSGIGPDGVEHDRFRTWKESLRDAP